MAIAENTGLKELNMSWNYFRNQGAAALARGFEVGSLCYLLSLHPVILMLSVICLGRHCHHDLNIKHCEIWKCIGLEIGEIKIMI